MEDEFNLRLDEILRKYFSWSEESIFEIAFYLIKYIEDRVIYLLNTPSSNRRQLAYLTPNYSEKIIGFAYIRMVLHVFSINKLMKLYQWKCYTCRHCGFSSLYFCFFTSFDHPPVRVSQFFLEIFKRTPYKCNVVLVLSCLITLFTHYWRKLYFQTRFHAQFGKNKKNSSYDIFENILEMHWDDLDWKKKNIFPSIFWTETVVCSYYHW